MRHDTAFQKLAQITLNIIGNWIIIRMGLALGT
jgi:hypothetical protein